MIIAFIVAAIVAAASVFIVLNIEKAEAQTEAVAQTQTDGFSYITKMEAVETTPIEDRIFEEDNRISPEELLAQFETNPDLIWKTLKDLDTLDRKSTRLNSSHRLTSRMPSSA